MNRKAFFDNIRPFFDGFRGALGKGQIEGLDAILDEAEKRKTPTRHLAYILASAFHETNATMQPVKEAYWLSEAWRKRNLRYYPYYGRGLIQITWKENYKKAGDKLEIDLVNNPDDALDLPTSVEIMFSGMEEGWFTGKKLSDYPKSYKQSRRIVNGLDKASVIAGYAERFEEAIEAAD
jgi:hypothetical protein